MFEQNISNDKSKEILNLSEEQIRESVEVKNGDTHPVSIPGIEVEVEWDNPESIIISHFWLDPKLRGNGIGKIVLSEIINQSKNIERINVIYTTIQASQGSTKNILKKQEFDEVLEIEDDYWGEIIEGRLYIED